MKTMKLMIRLSLVRSLKPKSFDMQSLPAAVLIDMSCDCEHVLMIDYLKNYSLNVRGNYDKNVDEN